MTRVLRPFMKPLIKCEWHNLTVILKLQLTQAVNMPIYWLALKTRKSRQKL